MTAGHELAAVLGLRAAWLPRLPAPSTLACAAPDALGELRTFWVTTSRPAYEAASRTLYPVITGHAWVCLADAAEREATALALAQWLLPSVPLGVPPPFAITGSLYGLLAMADRRERSVADLAAACAVRVGDVLSHFGAHLLALDPPIETCSVRDARLF